jgi:hypothetical protein
MLVRSRRFVVSFSLGMLGLLAVLALAASNPAAATGISDMLVNATGTQPQAGRVVVRLTAGAAEVVTVSARGGIRKGGHVFGLRPAKATVAATRRAALELRPRKGWQERKILHALRSGKSLVATVRVRAVDFVGNTARRTITVRLT